MYFTNRLCNTLVFSVVLSIHFVFADKIKILVHQQVSITVVNTAGAHHTLKLNHYHVLLKDVFSKNN